LNDYAAFLISHGGNPFYLIHGGISCDLEVIYPDLFAIDILIKEYVIRIMQQHSTYFITRSHGHSFASYNETLYTFMTPL